MSTCGEDVPDTSGTAAAAPWARQDEASAAPSGPGTEPSGGLRRPMVLAALALIVAVAAGLRLVQVYESLWLDELHTAWTASDGWEQVRSRASLGNHPPLYFLVAWASVQVWGLSELALRLPSVIAGVALVVLVARTIRRWTGVWTAALYAAWLVALDRTCVFYSQEARSYALVQLIGLTQLLVFWSLLAKPSLGRRAAWIALTWTLFYLHYTAPLVLTGEVLGYALLWTRKSWRPVYRPSQLALDSVIWLLGCSPALAQLAEIGSRRSNWTFVERQPLQALWTIFPLDTYVLLPLLICAAAWGWTSSRPRRLAAGSAGDLPAAAQKPQRQVDPRLVVFFAAWFVTPVSLAWVATYWDWARLFFPRYLMIVAIAPLILSGLCFAVCPGRTSRLMCALVVSCVSLWQSGMIEQFRWDGRVLRDRSQDWRGAVALINLRAAQAQLPVFVRSGLIEANALGERREPQFREYCLSPVLSIYRIHRRPADLIPLATQGAWDLGEAERQRAVRAGGAWFMLTTAPENRTQVESRFLGGWQALGRKATLEEQASFGDVDVFRVRLTP